MINATYAVGSKVTGQTVRHLTGINIRELSIEVGGVEIPQPIERLMISSYGR